MTPAGIEPATFRFVAQQLNHCATAVPQSWKDSRIFCYKEPVSFTQEKADDLHNTGSPLSLATTVGWKHTDLSKNTSLWHYTAFFLMVAIC